MGQAYRAVVGKHFPAMALVQVAGLVEDGALLEIEGTAALPPRDVSSVSPVRPAALLVAQLAPRVVKIWE